MTKFLHYLNESRSKSITFDKALELIAKNCKKNLESLMSNSNRLYRGNDNNDNFLHVDSNKGEPRKSAGGSLNYMTLLMDNLPSWNGWPKRSRSIICSTNYFSAGSYGKVYYVIPYDNAKIGICSKDDIWDAFNEPIKYIPRFQERLQSLFYEHDLVVDDSKWLSLKKALLSLNGKNVFFNPKGGINNMINYFNKIMDPNTNNFKQGIDNLSKSPNEIFIQGESILLTHRGYKFEEIANYVKDLK